MSDYTPQINPVAGAAIYRAEITLMGWAIVMYPSDGEAPSIIDRKSAWKAAIKCANNWQKKENKAILKAQTL